MTAPQPGSMLTPNIRLERALARGGMGSVWLADHLGLRTKVVVKFIADEVASHPEVIARFEREAAAAAAVKSPHVVQMLDHGVSPDGLAYIAMEFLEGYPLAEHLDRVHLVPPVEVAYVISQAAKALARAHEKHVVHRDIKPDNIFLCDDGEGLAFVKVLDFGIAKVSGPGSLETTKTGAMLGTPFYMSPEQVMGSKSLDHRADVWALAVVAYEMLTGARPFEGETMGAISVRICAGEFALPSAVNPGLPEAIDAVFAQALAKDVAWRFSTARAFADALETAAGGTKPIKLASRPRVAQTLLEVPSDARAAQTTPMHVTPPTSGARPPSFGGSTVTPTVATPPPSLRTTGQTVVATAASGTVSEAPRRSTTPLAVLGGAVAFGALIGVWFAIRPAAVSTSAAAAPADSVSEKPGVEKSVDAPKPAPTSELEPTAATASASAPRPAASGGIAKSPAPKATAPASTALAPPVKAAPAATGASPLPTAKAKTNDPDMW